MDPEFIREQVKNVWRVLAANAKLIKDRNLTIEGAFVASDFTLNQASVLFDAVTDSISLKSTHAPDHQFVIMKPEFLSEQGSALKAAIDDSARLQDPNQTTHAGLTTLSDSFILNLARNLRDVVGDNATIAMQHQVQPNTLYTSSPNFTARLAIAFDTAINAYVQNRKGIVLLKESNDIAARALQDLKAQTESLSAEKAAAFAKASELEAFVLTLQQNHEQLQATAQGAADAAQARIRKLEEELSYVSSEHMICGTAVQRCDSELSALREEHKKLVQAHEGQREAVAQASRELEAVKTEKREIRRERDALAVELSQTKRTQETFVLTQAQEHERMKAEILRLEDVLQQQESASKQLTEEKAQLKATLNASETELLQTQNQLAATMVQSDTWKAELEAVIARQASEVEQMRQNAAQERDNADVLLQNAGKIIEILEGHLREKDNEIARLREEIGRNPQPAVVAAPPPLAAQPSSSSNMARKRSATEGAEATASARTASSSSAWTVNLAAHGSPMPPDRVRELAALPEIVVDLGPGQSIPAIFTRQSLSTVLGGSIQGLIVRCTESATPLARSHNISCYLCPNMDHNAWSPSGPGKHGYMQVGLGRDRDLFNDGEYRHVFVGAGKHFVYCGWYHVLRVERLTKEEWGTLPPKVQSTYAATTMNKEKSKEFKSSQHVLAMYNAGELRAPCVRLQCIGFDTAFYQELVRANDQYFEHKPRPLPPAGGAGGAATRKRRRVSKAEEKAEDSEVEVSLASGMATTRLPASSITIEPSPAMPPPSASAAGEVTVAQNIIANVPMVMMPSVNAGPSAHAGPSAQGPSLSPVRSTRSSTARASGSLTLRIPGGRAMDRGSQPDWPDDSEGNLSSASDEDDWYADP